ncbi:lysoplasmalogenase [Pedobacter immunditicola]|uniref:lysoplasmalogenase n=1 Tax=Pedobacter immunditicola TaxID=3133440 RepID=UPI0030A40181
MFKQYKAFSLLFLLIFIVQLFVTLYSPPTFAIVLQAGVLLALIVFFVQKTKLKGRFHKRLFTGFVFTLLSGILLLFPSVPSIYSWTCFLLVHLFYIRAFYLDFRSAQELDKKNARSAILACTVLGMGFYIYLRPFLESLRLPLMLFTFVSCMMLMMAVFRNLRVNQESFNLIFAGVLLFVLSNSLLALHLFTGSFPLAELWITSTYLAAQYFIVKGGVERKLLNN